jgi:hypothetical protein
MGGPVPAIHVLLCGGVRKTWMPAFAGFRLPELDAGIAFGRGQGARLTAQGYWAMCAVLTACWNISSNAVWMAAGVLAV